MPITIVSKSFKDVQGNSNPFYRANAGDRIRMRIVFKSEISVQSGSQAFLQLDPVQNIISWSSGNWLTEGFRQGDTVLCTKYSSGGSAIFNWFTQVANVTANDLDLDSVPTWIDNTLGEIIKITVINTQGGFKRQAMTLDFNHFLNGQTGNEFSYIDGEVTRFTFDLMDIPYGTSGNVAGTPIGNKSGQYVIGATMQDVTANYVPYNPSTQVLALYYQLEVTFLQSGIYDQSNFNAADCLKAIVKTKWQRLFNEPSNSYSFIYNDDADTGWYDEAYNLSVPEATMVQGVNALAFDSQTSGQIIIDFSGASGQIGLGASYIPQDDAYFKNKPQTQSELGMVVYADPSNWLQSSFVNPDGAKYDLEITAINQIGTTFTIDYTFTPNADFETFFEGREDGDKLFYLWVMAGNINLLAFNGQVTSNPPIGGKIDMIVADYLDHSENVTDSTDVLSGYEANIEDDLAFVGKFRLHEGITCGDFTAKIEAHNISTDEVFTLQQMSVNIASIPMVAGKYILNETLPIFTQFQTTSEKRNGLLILDSSIDSGLDYGVKVFFPFLYDWRYWLAQANADNDFYPNNQTKNWLPYGTQNPWELRLVINVVKDELLYYYNDMVTIKDYDSDKDIFQEIELYIDSTNQNVSVVTEGEMMRVVGTHTIVTGESWKQNEVWGMITVEPKESAPRYWCSTIVPYDNNTTNPLSPLTGLYCDLTFPQPNVARMECYFNPDKINLQNGCKFTTKIKGCFGDKITGKQKADGTLKQKTDGTIKQKA
jgi:hypothetical protein